MQATFYELNPLPSEVIHHHMRESSCPAVVKVQNTTSKFWTM